MGRRNLADVDRIALARKREEILRPIADERKRSGKGEDGSGGRGNKKTLPQNCGKVSGSRHPTTSKEAAKSAGVGERTYDAGKLVWDAVEKGEIDNDELDAIRRKEKPELQEKSHLL